MRNPFIEAAAVSKSKPKAPKPKWIQAGEFTDRKFGTVTVMRHVSTISRNKYQPHQGKQECQRRMK